MKPAVSIVVPCYNEEKHLGRCIHSLLTNDYVDKEIIIVDGGSTDGTLELLETFGNYPEVRVFSNPARITPVSLNIGISKSSGDFIMIAGSHTSYPPQYISGIIREYASRGEEVVLIGGLIRTVSSGETYKTSAIQKVLASKWGVGDSLFRTGVSAPTYVDTVPFGIYRRRILEDLKGYNERLTRNHDIELNKRIIRHGKRILLIPSLTCDYYARETFRGIGSNNFQNGFWNIKTVRITRDFSSLSVRHFIPLLFILSLILPLAAWLFSSMEVLLLPAGLSLLAYLLVIVIQSCRLLDSSTRFRYVFYSFLILHFSYGVGSLVSLLSMGFFNKRIAG